MDLLETKLKKIFQSCELIIGLTVIANIVIFYISYQFFVREDQKLIQNLLTSQSKVIKELAIYDISKFFSEQNAENDYRYIENSLNEKCDLNNFQVKTTYNSLQTKINDKCRIIDLSKIRETLSQLYTKDYIYNIRLNDILLFNNKMQDNFVMFKDEVILNDLYKILIELSLQEDSSLLLERKEIFNQKLKMMLICLTIIDIFSIFIFFKTKKERTLRTKNENYLEKVKKFILEENSFIAESYKFSKNNRSQSENKDSDYFPLPIIDIKQEKNININLVDLCSEIESYFDCYSEYIGNNNIKLEFDCEKSAKALFPFEKEVLKQIIISIIVNLLNFSRKSNDPRTITISANDSTFAFISNGFKLNKQIAITASQRIFFDSLNPFILNFSQIIGLLNKHDLDITIDYDNQFSFIKLDFLQKVISIDEKNIGKVINFKSYGKRI